MATKPLYLTGLLLCVYDRYKLYVFAPFMSMQCLRNRHQYMQFMKHLDHSAMTSHSCSVTYAQDTTSTAEATQSQ